MKTLGVVVTCLTVGRLAEQRELQDNWALNIQAGVIDPDKMSVAPGKACH